MNPMTNVKNIKKLNEQELRRSLKTSWHDQYKDSAWIFVGGLPYDLTEGDIICVFSQYGEVVNINLVRDKDTGKQKGFCFLCYEDQRSTVLAVDNFNGVKLLGRTLRVDHVADYKAPKDSAKKDAETRRLLDEGCASAAITSTNTSATSGENMIPSIKKEKEDDKNDCMIIEHKPPVIDLKGVKSEFKDKKKRKDKVVPKVKVKKEKDSEKKRKRKKRRSSSSSSSDESSSSSSSSSDSSTTSSSEDSDGNEKKTHSRKHKHKSEKKKKLKGSESGLDGTQSSASSKRRKLEEKIKALEKALNSVRSGKSKQK